MKPILPNGIATTISTLTVNQPMQVSLQHPPMKDDTMKEKKDKATKPKKSNREQKRKDKQEMESLTQEIFLMFVKRNLMVDGWEEQEAENKARKRWDKAGKDIRKVFGQLAFIESMLIGDGGKMKKNRRADTSKRKEEWFVVILTRNNKF